MANYHVELPGKLSLAKQSKAIEGEEALGAKFVGARIWVNAKNLVTNLAEFEELNQAPATPLHPPTLSTSLPVGVTPAWAGPLIVADAAVAQVYLVR
jgi:hypothetical protein